MRKPTIVIALLLAMTVPTITSYANWTTAVPKSNYEVPYTDPSSMPGGKDNPWAGSTMAHLVVRYPGRIEGTWQKRGDEYYYILPDGSDLKNNYVDGLYLSWTGKMMKEIYVSENKFIYNTLYGGQMPISGYVDGGDGNGLLRADLTHEYVRYLNDYKAGAWNVPNQAKNTLDWMNGNMPTLLALPEKERTMRVGRIIANTLTHNRTRETVPATAFAMRVGNDYSYGQLFNQFMYRCGIHCVYLSGGQRSDGTSGAWNKVTINGADYYVDTVMYDRTRQDTYLFSPTLWAGYLSEQEVVDKQTAQSKKTYEKIREEEITNPIPKGGRPINGELGGAM